MEENMRGVVVLLVASGCLRTVTKPSCAESESFVADGEQTPAGTAEELLARAVHAETVDGVLAEGGGVVPVTWSVARQEGSARWIESHPEEAVTRMAGIGSFETNNIVWCFDRLSVPVVLAVSTEGGEVEIAVNTVVESRAEPPDKTLSVFGDGPYEAATLPDLPSEDPADWDDKEAFAMVSGLDGPGPITGRAGWEGNQVTEVSQRSIAVTVIEFPVGHIAE